MSISNKRMNKNILSMKKFKTYIRLNEKTDLGVSKWLNERNDLDIIKDLNEKTTQSIY